MTIRPTNSLEFLLVTPPRERALSLYDLSLLQNDDLLRSFATLLTHRSRITAAILAHIAEIDARNLYLAEGFDSMKAYCVAKLELTEDSAKKGIQVARLARQLPVLFPAIADGRLSLFTARLLAPRLTPANVSGLIEEASHKPAREIEVILARRFPMPEVMRLDDGISAQGAATNHHVVNRNSTQVVAAQRPDVNPGAVRHPEFVKTSVPRFTLKPMSADRYNLQVSLSCATHDKIRRLQDLLGHAVPNGDLAEVIDRALDAAIQQLERRKFGVGSKPRASKSAHTIHAQIKQAVHERDGGQCTHRYDDGRRCGATKFLEYDHIEPVAKGGQTTIENLRLLCRAHNQYAAHQAFGKAFMARKRRRWPKA